MSTPDITKAQVLAIVGAVAGICAGFGLHVSAATQHSIVVLATTLPAVLVAADAWIRGQRSKIAAAVIASGGSSRAGAVAAPAGPVGPPAGG